MAGDFQWFYVAEGQRVGPVSEGDLRDLVRQGRVTADTLVWRDGMLDWKPLHLSPLAGAAAVAALPPLPPGPGGPGAPMGMIDAVSSCLNRYAQFSGRASRSELWYFVLFVFLCQFLVIYFSYLVRDRSAVLLPLVAFALLLPQLAVQVRRLHDTDRRGWWLLIGFVPVVGPLVLLVFFCLAPSPGRNRFG